MLKCHADAWSLRASHLSKALCFFVIYSILYWYVVYERFFLLEVELWMSWKAIGISCVL